MEIIVGLAIFYFIGSFLWKAIKPMIAVINVPRNDSSSKGFYTGKTLRGKSHFLQHFRHRKTRQQMRILIVPGVACLVGAVTALIDVASTGNMAKLGTVVVSALIGLILLVFGLAPYLLPDDERTTDIAPAAPTPQPGDTAQKNSENQFKQL